MLSIMPEMRSSEAQRKGQRHQERINLLREWAIQVVAWLRSISRVWGGFLQKNTSKSIVCWSYPDVFGTC